MLGYWWFIVRIWRIFVSRFLIDLSSFSPCSWRDLFPEKSSESRLTEKILHKSKENYRQLQKIVAGHSVHNKTRFKNSQPKPVIIPLIEISCSKFCEIISHGDIPSGASTLWCHPKTKEVGCCIFSPPACSGEQSVRLLTPAPEAEGKTKNPLFPHTGCIALGWTTSSWSFPAPSLRS